MNYYKKILFYIEKRSIVVSLFFVFRRISMEEIQRSILDAIDTVVKNRLKELSFSFYEDGVVTAKTVKDGITTYTVENQENKMEDLTARTGLEFIKGDAVQVMVRNGNFSDKFIDDYLPYFKN